MTQRTMRILNFIPAMTLAVVTSANAQIFSDDDAWVQDLDTLRVQLEEQHIDLYHSVTELEFDRKLSSLRQRSVSLTDEERVVELMRLVRMIGDGHTSIPLWDAPITQYPFAVSLVDDMVLVTGTSEEHPHLLGSTLTKINDVNISDIKDAFSQIVPFVENEHSERIRIGMYMLYHELLVGTGIIDGNSPASFTFDIDGEEQTINLTPIDRTDARNALSVRLHSKHPTSYFNKISSKSDSVWFGASQESDVIYLHLGSYPNHSEMDEFATTVVDYIRDNNSEYLIIDLRHNFGGDFFVGLKLASYLNLADSINWRDGVYVLTDNVTFSAAMSNTAQFKQILNAKQVGEPTGARPCGPQDMSQFTLPNSKLLVTLSKRQFCFIKTDHDTIMPDVRINRSAHDYVSQSDSVLEWVMKDIKTNN